MVAVGNTKLPALIAVVILIMGSMSLWGQEFAGGDGSEAEPWQIETVVHLNNVRNYLGEENSDKHFIQTADIDLEDFLWDEDDYINDGEGWEPIGDETNRFTGKYNGNSKTISGLFINRSGADNQGLFGYTDGALIFDLGVTDGNVSGGEAVGVLAGLINNTTVTNCYTTGDVAGLLYTGGLAGRSSGSSEVFGCHSDVTVAKYELPAPSDRIPFIQGGTFTPARDYTVTLSSFYIGRYPVRQSEYLSLMGTNPSNFGGNTIRPVEMVSWFDAIEYCNRLSIREGLNPCYSFSDGTGEDSTYYGTNPDNWPEGWNTDDDHHTDVSCNWNASGYRLPTEMEREFAARGGVPAQNAGTFNNRWPGTNVMDELVDYGWFFLNSGRTTHPVGRKLPNELELYDMSGNVWNWCWDITNWPLTPYPTGEFYNPTGPTNGTDRIMRGGSWANDEDWCTVSRRGCNVATREFYAIGLRVCRRYPYYDQAGFGGLIGYNDQSIIGRSYSTGDVRGESSVGGFVGLNTGSVNNSYSRGDVRRVREGEEAESIGGFCGKNHQGIIINCFSTGAVTYADNEDPTDKGFCGEVTIGGDYEMSGNYWDAETSGQTATAGIASGGSTEQMTYPYGENVFEDWDFDEIWDPDTNSAFNDGYPNLRWQGTPYPNIAVNPTPVNDTTNVSVALERLSWDYIVNPNTVNPLGFRVYFNETGEFGEDDDFVWIDYDENEETYSSSDILPGELDYFTAYYWKVVPTTTDPNGRSHSRNRHNSQLTTRHSQQTIRGDAENVPAWSFRTEEEPTMVEQPAIELITALKLNYPNPFNPSTIIEYSIREEANVKLFVYNLKGQIVRYLVDEVQKAGRYEINWNGTDNNGSPAGSGVYFYRLTTDHYDQVNKMLLVK